MPKSKKEKKKSLQEVYHEKSERVLEGVAYWASFYRKNPQRFVLEYLNVKLKLFQKNTNIHDDDKYKFYVYSQSWLW